MAETLLSPGVLTRENNTSQITQGPQVAGAAIVGPTVHGPVNIPTLVTTYSEFLNKFGGSFDSGSTKNEYLTSISAYNYFQQGGDTLLVTRVVSGTFAPATSDIKNGIFGITGNVANTSINTTSFTNSSTGSLYSVSIGTPGGNIYSLSPYVIDYTNGPLDYTYFNVNSGSSSWTKNQWGTALANAITNFGEIGLVASFNSSSSILEVSGSTYGTEYNGYSLYFTPAYQGVGLELSSYSFSASLGGGTEGVPNTSLVIETLSEGNLMNSSGSEDIKGALTNGTINNLRWEVPSVNIANGTFNLLVRRGDDNSSSKTILETWSNLSLDPNSPNYVESVIGNQTSTLTDDYINIVGDYKNRSKYIRIKSISPTLNYFDNNGVAKSEYTSSIPLVASGTFGNATGNLSSVNGVPASNYTASLNILLNKDEFKYDVITVPGLNQANDSATISLLISNTQDRGDAIAIIDLADKGANVSTAIGEASEIDSTYAASYYPWVQVNAPNTGKLTWVPPSTIIPSVYAYNDKVDAEWFAPAGFKRGGINVVQAERKLSPSDRDTLYSGKVNPIGTFPGHGNVVFGQKTLASKASALDRINVRRLLIALKSYIGQIGDTLVFQNNTIATRNSFLAKVRPYLDSIQQRDGLYAYKVVMDETNNTSDTIDRNQIIGQIYIQPAKTVEFVILDFNVSPTGSTFPGK